LGFVIDEGPVGVNDSDEPEQHWRRLDRRGGCGLTQAQQRKTQSASSGTQAREAKRHKASY
jgi:hypothetical protein